MAEIRGQQTNAGRALATRSKELFGGSRVRLQFQPNAASHARARCSQKQCRYLDRTGAWRTQARRWWEEHALQKAREVQGTRHQGRCGCLNTTVQLRHHRCLSRHPLHCQMCASQIRPVAPRKLPAPVGMQRARVPGFPCLRNRKSATPAMMKRRRKQ